MDGMPLYEYARQGKALPKPIEARSCTIHSLELLSFKKGGEHSWQGAKEEMSAEDKETMLCLERLVAGNVEQSSTAATDTEVGETADKTAETGQTNPDETVKKEEEGLPPAFEIRMTVSSGTYVRSLVHDIGTALGSAAHVVELVRTRQGMYALDPAAAHTVEGEDSTEPLHATVPWSVLYEGIKNMRAKKPKQGSKGQKQEATEDASELTEEEDSVTAWEQAIVAAINK